MRASLLFVLLGISLLAPSATLSAPAVVVLKLTSVDAALDDIESLGLFEDPVAERERLLGELVAPLNLPLGEWLDRQRSVFVVGSQAGLMGGPQGAICVLPVLDAGDALRALGGSPDAETQAGVHVVERDGELDWYVKLDDDTMTVGTSRDEVADLDRVQLENLHLPAGNIGIDLNLELVAPIIEGAFNARRQAMQQQMESFEQQRQDAGMTPEPGSPDPKHIMNTMNFYIETVVSLLRNISHVQLSLENAGEHAIVHSRLLSMEESELQTLLRDQPVGFPKLARAVPQGSAMVAYAGNVNLTAGVQEGLLQFTDRYVQMTQQLLGDLIPEMSWMQNLIGGQSELMKQRLECWRGDSAGLWDLEGETGLRSIQLSGVRRSGDCGNLAEQEVAAMQEVTGPDDEPLFSVTDPAVMHGGVKAVRVELDMARFIPTEDEAASKMLEAMVGNQAVLTYYGQTDDVTVTVAGADADRMFAETADRLQSRRKKGGLTAETFSPLTAGSGFYATLDLSKLESLPGLLGVPSPAEEHGEDEEDVQGDSAPGSEEQPVTGKVVFGAHSEQDALALDLALPTEVVRSWLAEEDDQADELPPGLWPPPPAPADQKARPGEASEDRAIENVEDVVHDADDEDVTLPEIVHKTAPDYPEMMRLARLEGRIVLQAIVARDGNVKDLTVLQCDGKSPDEAEARENLLLESRFCLAFSDAAIAAVERWRYEPARKDGEPVDVYFTIRVDFELE